MTRFIKPLGWKLIALPFPFRRVIISYEQFCKIVGIYYIHDALVTFFIYFEILCI